MFRRTDRRRAFALAGVALLLSAAAARAGADVKIPPAPAQHFNDYAALVSPGDAQLLDAKLEAFERESSTQIVVAIFPELPEPSLEDFTVRSAQAWRVGQKKLDNGLVLFVFVKDRQSRIEVGYGLEDKVPDVTAKRILQDVMAPPFKQGQYAAGLDAALDALIAATRGAYTPGPTAASPRGGQDVPIPLPVLIFLVIVIIVVIRASRGGGGGGFFYTGGGWSSGGGSSWGGGGGGGFSGGGGSFGGGGASGSW